MNRAAEIGRLHGDSEANRIAIRDLLQQQKKECGHGKFLPWLEANKDVLGFGIRQAQFYMLSDAKRLRMLERSRVVRKPMAEMSLEEIAARCGELHRAIEADQQEIESIKASIAKEGWVAQVNLGLALIAEGDRIVTAAKAAR